MKRVYGQFSVKREFPCWLFSSCTFACTGSALPAKYNGPFKIQKQVGDTNYVTTEDVNPVFVTLTCCGFIIHNQLLRLMCMFLPLLLLSRGRLMVMMVMMVFVQTASVVNPKDKNVLSGGRKLCPRCSLLFWVR